MTRRFLLSWLPLAAALLHAGPGAGADLTLRGALVRGIERNLDLRIQEVNVPVFDEGVVAADAAFDPELQAGVDASGDRRPVSASGAADDRDTRHAAGADVGVRKRFTTGLESRVAVEALRATGDPESEQLDPRYRTFLVLDLTQPLLRDRGSDVNTADLRVSRNQAMQARCGYLDRALRVGEEIELAYYNLGLAQQVLAYRLESRRLAAELRDGNRERFEAGVVPVTEVQQAETAVAARDEQVVFAYQLVETVAARLKDLLEIRSGDLLAGGPLGVEPLPGADGEVPGFEAALAAALEGRPDLRERRLELENWDIRLVFFANQTLPRLDLEATLGLNGLSGDARHEGSPAYEGGYLDSVTRLPDGDGYQWFAGLRLSYPLGNRAADARYRQVGWEKRRAVYGLKRLEGQTQTELEAALVDARRGLERFRVAERAQALAETTLAQETSRLKEGLSDTFRVLTFQDDVVQARIRKETALADFHKGLASLYRAMGRNLARHGIVAELTEKEGSRETM